MLGRSSGKALEPYVDLAFDEEVPSRRVGGGRASVVRPGRTAFTCRTRPGSEDSNRGQDVRRLRTTGRRSGLAIVVGGRRQLRARSPPSPGWPSQVKAAGCYELELADTCWRVSASRVQIPAPAPLLSVIIIQWDLVSFASNWHECLIQHNLNILF